MKARLPAMDGSQCSTQPYFETPDGQPLRFTMGEDHLSHRLSDLRQQW